MFISIMILLLAVTGEIIAQTDQEPFSEEKSEKMYYIQPTSERPAINGVLDEPIWLSIAPITDFVQEEPDNMAEPTERMEVYLTYDDQYLYVAARLYDSNPSAITRQLAPQDDWYGAFDEMADWFSIALDSRHDHQTAFSFAVNASGVLSDEMVYNDADYDTDWNAIWQAEVQIDDEGWSLEMEIPFSNLPFYESDELTWGINITRFIQRKYETITWVAFPPDIEGVASKYGHVIGLKGIYPPAKLELRPYIMAGVTSYSDIRLKQIWEPWSHQLNYYKEPNNNIGLDITYHVHSSSELMLAINPDFGQIESDPANINLTAFETYFVEKRHFFLKDTDIFETPIEIFYSRRIGQNSSEAGMTVVGKDTFYNAITIPTKINIAGKLTGKNKNGLSYGLLSAIVTEKDSNKWNNYYNPDTIFYQNKYPKQYLISRIKQDMLFGNSFLGFMSTSSLADTSHTFSVDGMANFFENQLGIDGQIIMTSDERKGVYGNISFYPLGYLSGWVDYYYYETGLNINDLGYLWRDDYTQTKLGLKFQTLESWYMIRNASIILEGDMEENTSGLDLGKTIELNYDMRFNNFWNIGGGFYKVMDYYDDRKIIYDYDRNDFGPPILIPEIMCSHFNLTTDKHRSLWTTISSIWSTNTRDDLEHIQYVGLNYKPNSYLSFLMSYDYYFLEKKYHWLESFFEDKDAQSHHIFSTLNREVDILTLRTIVNINRKLSIHGYLEVYYNHDIYSNYTEYYPDSQTYDSQSDYVNGQGIWQGHPVYTTSTDSIDLVKSYVDPNFDLQFHPKYTDFRSIFVVKWNYRKGSNLYFVFSNNKGIDGYQYNKINQWSNFIKYNDYKPWVEVLRDQTIMLKIDYWFEK